MEENQKISQDYWIKGQESLIDQLKQSIENSTQMIDLHTRQLELSKAQLAHEEKYLQEYVNSLK